MDIKSLGLNSKDWTYAQARVQGPSEETKQVFKLSNEIASINRKTEYIQKYGEAPPNLTFDYKKLLDVY